MRAPTPPFTVSAKLADTDESDSATLIQTPTLAVVGRVQICTFRPGRRGQGRLTDTRQLGGYRCSPIGVNPEVKQHLPQSLDLGYCIGEHISRRVT